jgi:hypothetical protein
MMEDPGGGIPELLVTTDVSLHWAVHKDMRPMPPDKGAAETPNGQAEPTSDPRPTMGHHQHLLWNSQKPMGMM